MRFASSMKRQGISEGKSAGGSGSNRYWIEGRCIKESSREFNWNITYSESLHAVCIVVCACSRNMQ